MLFHSRMRAWRLPRQIGENLSGPDGRVTLAGLNGGRYQLRIRRIGYVPADMPAPLAGGEQLQVHIVLVHAPVMLSAVRVVTYPPCRTPGLPDRGRQQELADLLVQTDRTPSSSGS